MRKCINCKEKFSYKELLFFIWSFPGYKDIECKNCNTKLKITNLSRLIIAILISLPLLFKIYLFKFGINVIVASIPAGIIGMLFYDNIKALFRPEAVIVGFIVGGILLLVIEGLFRSKKHAVKDIDEITPGKSLIVGCFQVLSMWPGMSRSASTIMGGWIAGLSTPIAAEFSFFLAVPAMIGSSAKDLFEFDYSIMNSTLWIALVLGFIVAFVVSIIVMKKFIDYLKKKPMRVFAIYRVAAGILLAVLVFTKIITLS